MVDTAYLLLVDDEETIRTTLKESLEDVGHHVTAVANAMRARESVNQGKFDVAVLDLSLPDGHGLDLLKEFKKIAPNMGVILITGTTELDSVADAIEMGADALLKKPFKPEALQACVADCLKKNAGEHKNKTMQNNKTMQSNMVGSVHQDMLIGQSVGILKVKETALMLGESDSTVLITGESGTGKEVLANLLHCSGTRAKKPFVSINCGAIPEELLESELFGHIKGSFTGAVRSRMGRFEVANGGTIFLDEIGDMSPKLQVKLLRVLQERCFEPVGSHESVHIDVRVIAATHRELEDEIEEGRFRQDLFYRLNVIPIELPALRERGEDVMLLAEHFLAKFNREKSSDISSISDAAKKAMLAYAWPGNVRELQNLMERVTTLKRQGSMDIDDFPSRMLDSAQRAMQDFMVDVQCQESVDFKGIVDEFESHLILSALDRFDWNKNQAAKFLSMNRTTLVEKIKKKGLEAPV